jgi:[acyl-carrier-protein] S-malonyltransferase
VTTGQVIGHVATRQGPVEVAAHDGGLLTEWLAHHDDPVAPGQPVARIGGHA